MKHWKPVTLQDFQRFWFDSDRTGIFKNATLISMLSYHRVPVEKFHKPKYNAAKSTVVCTKTQEEEEKEKQAHLMTTQQ